MTMRPLNSIDESTNKTIETVNSSKGSSTSKLKDLSGKLEEAIGSDVQTPNPQKAPLNYIDNMGEWENAQKKFEEAIAKKQQELGAILGDYEDKIKETDRFREAKTDLEIRMLKVMGVIMDKLEDNDDFILDAYEKLYPEGDATESVQEVEDNANIIENVDEAEEQDIEKVEEQNIEEVDEQDVEKTEEQENKSGNAKNQIEKQGVSFMSLLGDLGFSIAGISVVPFDGTEDGEGNVLEYSSEVLLKFLEILSVKNWDKNKELLTKDEVEKFEKLYAKVKKQCNNYLELSYQIELLTDKISELESNKAKIYTDYYNGVKDEKKMLDNMGDLNKTYSLNSYLFTKNVSFDSFVSSELVEKQIANIIERNKKGLPLPKTILLYGKSNLGKSYAAKVLASELGRKMYHIKSCDIKNSEFPDAGAMLDAIFLGAINKKEPCIIFLDEIEEFSKGLEGSVYQDETENTIRHHISKIKESSLDIMIIGAISDKNKVNQSLLKQDVFSKQIFFTSLTADKYEDLFCKMVKSKVVKLGDGAFKTVKLGDDINVSNLIAKIKDSNLDQEYLVQLIDKAIDFHPLDDLLNADNVVLSSDDFNHAIDSMLQSSHNVSQGVGYNR